jgi:hypothetical protein
MLKLMLNFFRKKRFDKKIPPDYQHIMDQKGYEKLVDIAMNYFREKGEKVVSLQDGMLTVKGEDGKDLKYGFDNLVRMLTGAQQDDWESIIYSHFNKINFSDDAYNYFFKDYEHAKQYLKVLVKHEAIMSNEFAKDLVLRTDFPGTRTVLVFDYDNQFRYLKAEEIAEWNLPAAVLFEEALSNVAAEELNINKMSHDDGWDFYSFFSGDFSASRMIELEKYFDFSMGQFGALVAIPTKGSTFVSPLTDNRVTARIEVIAPLVAQFFEQDPGNITNDFYWVYQGVIESFPTQSTGDGFVTVKLPQSLVRLLDSTE